MAKNKVKDEIRLNSDELKEHLKFVIKNNRFLQKQGKLPIAVAIQGEAGLGKTSVIMQVASEMKLDCIKRNLQEIQETAELIGFPLRQFELCKDDKCLWVDEHAISEYIKQGYTFTGNKQTGYCPPQWIANMKEGTIFLIDDFNRASEPIMQACMEIINRHEFISWKLPKDCHIIMSQNPDDGTYMVQSQDVAQKSRYCTVNMKFDVACWARQMEKEGLDGRCINFLLRHPEIIKDENLKEGVNPRSITNFFNSISSIIDFDKNLSLIQQIGESSVGVEVANLFSTFIAQRLDKLISPQEMLTKDWKTVKADLIESCGKGDSKEYRPDIASIMTTRLINYTLFYAEKNTVDQKMIDRIIALTTDDDLLAMDLKYVIIRELLNKHKSKFQKLLLNSNVIKMTVK